MAQLVVTNFTSIDGVIQSPLSAEEDPSGGFRQGGWVVPYSDDSVADFMRRATVAAEGLLLGGRTYAILADAWSAADESEPAVAAMNRMPKYVVSRSVETSIWQNSDRLDSDDVGHAVRELKTTTAGELVVLGSGTLVASLSELDLIDEYRLLVFPVVLGAGRRMFDERGHLAHFELTGVESSQSGVAMLTYIRDR